MTPPTMSLSKYSTLNLHPDQPAKLPPNLTLTLKPVTSDLDVPALATINDRALDADLAFKRWMAMFTERTDWDTTVSAVTEAIGDPEYRLVKAVVSSDDGEKIVGFIHWFCGWIVLEKVDPFAVEKSDQVQSQQTQNRPVADIKDVASNVAETLADEAAALEEKPRPTEEEIVRARRLKKGEKKYIRTRNHYIAAIRGKRHMFIRRIMVLPEYQGMGIGRQLMKVVTDEADRLKIVCWLFARPMGVRMYERFGYVTVGVTEMDEVEEGFECPETRSMMRVAQPVASLYGS